MSEYWRQQPTSTRYLRDRPHAWQTDISTYPKRVCNDEVVCNVITTRQERSTLAGAKGHAALTILLLVGMVYRMPVLARADAVPLSNRGCQLAI